MSIWISVVLLAFAVVGSLHFAEKARTVPAQVAWALIGLAQFALLALLVIGANS